MKVGSIIRRRPPRTQHADSLVGLVMQVFDNGDIGVLFEDGEFQVDGNDYEVME
jgi:hypothetical protein